MRITFVLPPVNMSGGLRVVSIYAKQLIERGHTVTLISPAHPKVSLFNKLKTFLHGKGWSPSKPKMSHIYSLGHHHYELGQFRPVAEEDVPDADIVIATWWETAEWVNKFSARKGKKIYFVQHHEVFKHLPVARACATYRMPFHKIVVAPWLARVMREEYSDYNVDIVNNAVDHEQFFATVRGKQDRPTVGFLFHYMYSKGVDVTLAAIEKLRVQLPNLRVISFGAKQPGNDFFLKNGDMEFHLLPPQDKLRYIYSQCDVWITASRSEGFNLPAMEAMACRTPVASTKAGWPEDAVVTGHNGVLVNVDDVAALEQGILKILSLSDEEWRMMSANAYATVESSSWSESANLFEAALKRVN